MIGLGLYLGNVAIGKGGGFDPFAQSFTRDGWDARRADTFTLAGSLVSAWRSVKGLSAEQAFTTSKPVRNPTGLNGQAVVEYDGLDDALVAIGVGSLPTGANPGEVWLLVNQAALVADTGERTIFGYGNTASVSRRFGRRVLSAQNCPVANIGDGSTLAPANGPAGFDNVSVVRVEVGSAQSKTSLNGTPGTSAAVVPATTTTRTVLGAAPSSPQVLFHKGGIVLVVATDPLNSSQAAQMLAYFKSVGGLS